MHGESQCSKSMSDWKFVALWSAIGAAAIELLTVILRFGFRLESTRDTASTVGVLTMGIRVHHGYIGIFLILLVILLSKFYRNKTVLMWLLVAGIALFVSDTIHHFIVLWLATGSPEFDLVY